MLLHICIAALSSCIFLVLRVTGNVPSSPALALSTIDSPSSSNLISSFGSITRLSLINDHPNGTDFLKAIIDIQPNATLCELCQLNTGQLCEYYAFHSESYTITTADGYILTVFRCWKDITQKQPVLLVHGMMDSSDTWFLTGVQSLAYKYVEKGYDVHLINCRGNRYSRQHTSLSPEGSAFWHFTFDEMADYDVPETIEMIRKKTGSDTLQIVGHSLGGTIVLALLSSNPRYNKIITHVGLLAPFTFMEQVGFPLDAIINAFYFGDFADFELVPHTDPQMPLAQGVCRIANGLICNSALNFVLGPSINQIDPSVLPIIFCHFPAGCTSRQLKHFGFEYNCKYFGRMTESSIPICNQTFSSFDLSRVTTAISLFFSRTDPHSGNLGNPINFQVLIKHLKNANLQYIERPEFNHIDFVWGKNADVKVYDPIIARAATFAP